MRFTSIHNGGTDVVIILGGTLNYSEKKVSGYWGYKI